MRRKARSPQFHFPFASFHFSFFIAALRRRAMTNDNSKMETGK
jgi:hypothetical protein